MEIIKEKSIQNNLYYCNIKIVNLNDAEKKLLEKYGEPYIDIGGEFNTFSIPHYYKKIIENTPHTFFDENKEKVDEWADEIEKRIHILFTQLKNKPDNFTGTTLLPPWTGSDMQYKYNSTYKISEIIDIILQKLEEIENKLKEIE